MSVIIGLRRKLEEAINADPILELAVSIYNDCYTEQELIKTLALPEYKNIPEAHKLKLHNYFRDLQRWGIKNTLINRKKIIYANN